MTNTAPQLKNSSETDEKLKTTTSPRINSKKEIKAQKGDRIIINNVPENYHYKDLYITEGKYEGVVSSTVSEKNILFMTNYVPYLDNKGNFSCSGCGNSISKGKANFLKRDKANFWKFKNNVHRGGNGETYSKVVNCFEIDFRDLN